MPTPESRWVDGKYTDGRLDAVVEAIGVYVQAATQYTRVQERVSELRLLKTRERKPIRQRIAAQQSELGRWRQKCRAAALEVQRLYGNALQPFDVWVWDSIIKKWGDY